MQMAAPPHSQIGNCLSSSEFLPAGISSVSRNAVNIAVDTLSSVGPPQIVSTPLHIIPNQFTEIITQLFPLVRQNLVPQSLIYRALQCNTFVYCLRTGRDVAAIIQLPYFYIYVSSFL